MRLTTRIGAVALCALVSAGCSATAATPPGPVPTSAAGAPATAPATAAPATTDEGPEEITGAGIEQVSVDSPSGGVLTAVRTARHDTFDRVVFEFRDGAPGYLVGYVDEVTAEGSGDVVAVGGGAALLVVMRPATGFEEDLVTPVYAGPTRLPGQNTPQVVEVVRTGDFEGHLAWAVGVQQKSPFVVHTLTGPSRIVVDIAH